MNHKMIFFETLIQLLFIGLELIFCIKEFYSKFMWVTIPNIHLVCATLRNNDETMTTYKIYKPTFGFFTRPLIKVSYKFMQCVILCSYVHKPCFVQT